MNVEGLSDLPGADEATLSGDALTLEAAKQRAARRALIDAWQAVQDKLAPAEAAGTSATIIDRLASWVLSKISIEIGDVHVRCEETLPRKARRSAAPSCKASSIHICRRLLFVKEARSRNGKRFH